MSTGHPCTRNTRNTKVPAPDHPIWTPRPTPRSLLRRRTVARAPASASVNHVARGASTEKSQAVMKKLGEMWGALDAAAKQKCADDAPMVAVKPKKPKAKKSAARDMID